MGRVTLDDVTKIYDPSGESVVAVEDLNLDIADGEFLVLVGPSGCGKSTTLRMIAGLEEITSGTISIGGEIVNGMEPKERNIAMVFQNYALYPHMSVRENMSFGLRYSSNLSKDEIDDRIEQTAEMMGIANLLDDEPSQLSGGQRQRVALGRAIVREPQAFLFDEPLSNLDAKLRTRMRTEIARLQRDLGVTSIYVTHDQAEAMTMGDRVAVLNAGELQQVGEPNELYDHPVNKFVAGFIGSPSMNFMEVSLERRNGEQLLVSRRDESVFYGLDDTVPDQLPVGDGTDLTLGVRPEDIHIVRNPSNSNNERLLDATVDVVEPMGSDNFITLDVAQPEPWVARVDSSFSPEEGVQIAYTFDHSALHLFASDGQTLKSQGTNNESFHETELSVVSD